MSFLDKINAAPAAAPTKKVNPLLKKKLGISKKAEDSKEEDAPKKKVLPLKKKEAAPKKEVETKQEEVKNEAVEEAATSTEETVAETPKEKEKAPEKAKEESPSKKKEEKKEEEPKDKAKEEVKEEAPAKKEKTEAPEEKAKEKPKADKKTASKSTKKKSAAKKAKPEAAEDLPTDIPTTSVSFAEAVQAITSPFVDEEWEEFKNEVQEELSSIVIQDDMNPGTLKVVISELSILREKVWFSYQESKTLYERLSSKDPEGLIERIKRINLGSGNNDMERRKAGVLACMEYETEAGNVNLFEVLDETRARYNFLRSVIDSIKYKTDVLITLNGALKLEKDHVVRGD